MMLVANVVIEIDVGDDSRVRGCMRRRGCILLRVGGLDVEMRLLSVSSFVFAISDRDAERSVM